MVRYNSGRFLGNSLRQVAHCYHSLNTVAYDTFGLMMLLLMMMSAMIQKTGVLEMLAC